jgi:hypothetical protein
MIRSPAFRNRRERMKSRCMHSHLAMHKIFLNMDLGHVFMLNTNQLIPNRHISHIFSLPGFVQRFKDTLSMKYFRFCTAASTFSQGEPHIFPVPKHFCLSKRLFMWIRQTTLTSSTTRSTSRNLRHRVACHWCSGSSRCIIEIANSRKCASFKPLQAQKSPAAH